MYLNLGLCAQASFYSYTFVFDSTVVSSKPANYRSYAINPRLGIDLGISVFDKTVMDCFQTKLFLKRYERMVDVFKHDSMCWRKVSFSVIMPTSCFSASPIPELFGANGTHVPGYSSAEMQSPPTSEMKGTASLGVFHTRCCSHV